MRVHDASRIAVIGLIVVGAFVLVALGEITWEQANPLLYVTTGYLIGTGVLTVALTRAEREQLKEALTNNDLPEAQPEPQLHRRPPGEHLTGEHFLRPPEPYTNPAVPPGETPYDTIRRLPYVPSAPYVPASSIDGYEQAAAAALDEQPAPPPLTKWTASCSCGHPAVDHAESPTSPGVFMQCQNTSPAVGIPGEWPTVQCACNAFRLADVADHLAFRQQQQEASNGATPPR